MQNCLTHGKVTVFTGPLKGHTGTIVKRLPGNRVVLQLELFNRYQRVRLAGEVLLDEDGNPIPHFFTEEERKERIEEYNRLKDSAGEERLLKCMKKMRLHGEEIEKLQNGEERVSRYFDDGICECLGVSMKWVLFGDESFKGHPCGPQMIEYLEEYPERRETIWKWMQEDGYVVRDVFEDEEYFDDDYEEYEEEYEDFEDDF